MTGSCDRSSQGPGPRESLGLRKGVWGCLRLIVSSHPTVRREGRGREKFLVSSLE